MKELIKKLITVAFFVNVSFVRSNILPEDSITSNPKKNPPLDSRRLVDHNQTNDARPIQDLEREDQINTINLHPNSILPPDAERSNRTPDDRVENINDIPSVTQGGANIPYTNTLTPLDAIPQSQLMFSPITIKGDNNDGSIQPIDSFQKQRKIYTINRQCLESHEGVIFYPGEPRPIICDSFGSSTTIRTTRQDYDPSIDEFTSSTTSSTPLPNNYENCMGSCKMSARNKPVCGTNFITYFNFDHITCARRCGIDVLLLYDGECGRSTPLPITTTTLVPTTTTQNSAVFEQCVLRCPATPEYYPVCGSDFITYPNPSRLLCAKKCGKDVTEIRKGRCPTRVTTTSPRPTTTQRPIVSTTLSPVIKECISRCPVTAEYNPVCGSDFVTYTNPGRMRCVKSCGVDVRVVNQGRCRGSN